VHPVPSLPVATPLHPALCAQKMANFEEIAKAFVGHYYNLFDSGQRDKLSGLYGAESMLSFEAERFQGRDNIGKKLIALPFAAVRHQITTIDSQPTPGNGILIFVCGNLWVDQSENALKFSQAFNLLPQPTGGYFVLNDIFRLNYC